MFEQVKKGIVGGVAAAALLAGSAMLAQAADKVKIGMVNLAYNLRRYVWHEGRRAAA